jgi:hypothetical protein
MRNHLKKISNPTGRYPRFYEATHIEVLEATDHQRLDTGSQAMIEAV